MFPKCSGRVGGSELLRRGGEGALVQPWLTVGPTGAGPGGHRLGDRTQGLAAAAPGAAEPLVLSMLSGRGRGGDRRRGKET